MAKGLITVVCLSVLIGSASGTLAQQIAPVIPQPVPVPAAPNPPAATTAPKAALIPIRVDILLQRQKGTEKLSSLPYTLRGTVGNRLSLRLGSNVPISQGTNVTYQAIGDNFDCRTTALADGRYQLDLTVDDSSLADSGDALTAPSFKAPVIRSYVVTTTLILRDGETVQANVATDKVSGETITAQVTLTVLK